MNIKKIAGVIGATALIGATGGLAGPVLGVGFLGTAAIAKVVTGGVSALATMGVVRNAGDLMKSKKENEELREELRRSNMDNATKQKVIEKLNEQLEKVKAELEMEKEKTEQNAEAIRVMEEQIQDLLQTLQAAYAA